MVQKFPPNWNPVRAPLVGALFGSNQTKTWSTARTWRGFSGTAPGCGHREGDHKGRPYEWGEKMGNVRLIVQFRVSDIMASRATRTDLI